MNHNSVDDDLEEGEIADEVPTVPEIDYEERKVLPRRYVLHENKNGLYYKHKKRCKHSHVKKMARAKKTSMKLKNYKKHHKSCPHHSGRLPKYLKRPINHLEDRLCNHLDKKNEIMFGSHSLYAEMKSKNAFKNHPILSERTVKQNVTYRKLNEPSDICSRNAEKISDCEVILSVSQGKSIDSFTVSSENNHVSKETDVKMDLNAERKTDNGPQATIGETLLSDSVTELCEESEDEEELRRIALATCVKRNKLVENCAEENNNLSVPCSNLIVNSSLPSLDLCEEKSWNSSVLDCGQTSDNYEIVDMEVDDDNQSSKENIDDELFVIDTNPSLHGEFYSEVNHVTYPEKKEQTSGNDEEFEEQLLRAELIANMSRLQGLQSDVIIDNGQKVEEDNGQKINEDNGQKINEANEPKVNVETRNKVIKHRYPERCFFPSNKSLFKKVPNVVKKKQENLKLSEPNKIKVDNVLTQRIVIAVNEDSTTDESDGDVTQEEVVKENAVASLEALISDARHKSDEGKDAGEVGNVSKAVSCLSKAQQALYTSLKKKLAEKEKMLPIQSEHSPCKKVENDGVTDDLNLLEKKYLIAKANLAKENQLIHAMTKQYLANKSNFLKSKLSVQHLKEQLVAAERIKKSHFDVLAKCTKQVQTLKRSVAKRQLLINQLQNDCTRIGTTIRGQNYILPSLPSNDNVRKVEPS